MSEQKNAHEENNSQNAIEAETELTEDDLDDVAGGWNNGNGNQVASNASDWWEQ